MEMWVLKSRLNYSYKEQHVFLEKHDTGSLLLASINIVLPLGGKIKLGGNLGILRPQVCNLFLELLVLFIEQFVILRLFFLIALKKLLQL